MPQGRGIGVQQHPQHQKPAQSLAMLRAERDRHFRKLDVGMELVDEGPEALPVLVAGHAFEASGQSWPRGVGLESVE